MQSRREAQPAGLLADLVSAVRLCARQIVPMRRVLAVLSMACVGTVAFLAVLGRATDTPMALLTRDMAATAQLKFYIGILSGMGALLWCAAACVCWFGAAALRHAPGEGQEARFLGAFGTLLAALGADDFFMLHEVVYPKLGLPEEVVVALYAVALVALVLAFRRELLRSELLLFALGGLLFAGSVLVDMQVRDATALEDVLKVAGVGCWLTFFWRHALTRLRALRR